MRALHPHQQALVVFADAHRAAGDLWLEIPGRAVVLTTCFGYDFQGGPAVMLMLCPDWRAQDPTVGAQNGRLVLRPQRIPGEELYVYSYDPAWPSRLLTALEAVRADYPTLDTSTSHGASAVAARALAVLLAGYDKHVTTVSAVVARDKDAMQLVGDDWNQSLPQLADGLRMGIPMHLWEPYEEAYAKWARDNKDLEDPPSLIGVVEEAANLGRRGFGQP